MGGLERKEQIYIWLAPIVSVNCIRWVGHPPVLEKRKCFWRVHYCNSGSPAILIDTNWPLTGCVADFMSHQTV